MPSTPTSALLVPWTALDDQSMADYNAGRPAGTSAPAPAPAPQQPAGFAMNTAGRDMMAEMAAAGYRQNVLQYTPPKQPQPAASPSALRVAKQLSARALQAAQAGGSPGRATSAPVAGKVASASPQPALTGGAGPGPAPDRLDIVTSAYKRAMFNAEDRGVVAGDADLTYWSVNRWGRPGVTLAAAAAAAASSPDGAKRASSAKHYQGPGAPLPLPSEEVFGSLNDLENLMRATLAALSSFNEDEKLVLLRQFRYVSRSLFFLWKVLEELSTLLRLLLLLQSPCC